LSELQKTHSTSEFSIVSRPFTASFGIYIPQVSLVLCHGHSLLHLVSRFVTMVSEATSEADQTYSFSIFFKLYSYIFSHPKAFSCFLIIITIVVFIVQNGSRMVFIGCIFSGWHQYCPDPYLNSTIVLSGYFAYK